MLGQGNRKCVSVSLEYLGIQSPEQLKFGKQDSLALVWQLGILLYRVAFQDNHPFMSCVSNTVSSSRQNFDAFSDTVRNAGFIT